ncbi:MAG TPA: bifunctional [glutamine synthetase] adenylyltransferase/[glutamine synthetase]-adenylyl-L-tyrosine phosphorylase [Actinomycetota bacterium]|nr:bifunctional [glutamine synthetase] adenylyltransferase/[glutamine synthetase]-adenylyl-L-tyrosine phosphorylase [Actinomycetota bacterium]
MNTLPDLLGDVVARSAAPAAVALALERIAEHQPEARARLAGDPDLARATVAVVVASRSLAELLATEPDALDVLARLDRRPARGPGTEGLVAWQRREFLRIAARDLLGLDPLPTVGAGLADLAQDVFAEACVLAGEAGGDHPGLAVIGMGKLGGRELNYASDVDVMFVGEGDPLAVLAIARQCFRVDTNLRPEGRSGRLILPLDSFAAYWDRWAKPWEFQALLKARPVAGDASLGAAFAEAAGRRLWGRPFGAEQLRSVRAMKARSEKAVAARGLADREVKRGRGGIRDAEFAVQLLQLVHGGRDAALRSPNTLEALGELASAGYVDPGDAETLARGYTFLRVVEHRLQLEDNQQVHAVPKDAGQRGRLARVLGYRDDAARTALARFDGDLRLHQAAVRTVHEHLYFRPLLEAFAGTGGAMPEEAVDARLAAFGFTDPARTGRAVAALTRGLTRESRLMEQMLPLVLDWLSKSPDPDLGLRGLESLVGRARPLPGLVAAFRESPETARRLCLVLGTGRRFHRGFERQPELLADLGSDAALVPRGREALVEAAFSALRWRSAPDSRRAGLLRLKRAEELRIAAGDVVEQTGVEDVGRGLTHLAEAVLEAAISTVDPPVPLAVIAMGRFGGGELSYASDLDVLLVSGGEDPAAAHHAAEYLSRLVKGATPDAGIYDVDLDLRPEGRQGRLVRSIEEYRPYYERRAVTWERQALVRARPVAGDPALGAAFMELVRGWVWRPPTDDEVREIRRMKARIERERIPPREDPQFHLKLGKGSLSDVEWTVQLLQMTHGVRATGTMAALSALEGAGALSEPDARALSESYRFCERTRNRWFLMLSPTTGSAPPGRDSLPTQPEQLARLAASLGTTGPELRDRYRRVTRRARGVVERLFYGRTP